MHRYPGTKCQLNWSRTLILFYGLEVVWYFSLFIWKYQFSDFKKNGQIILSISFNGITCSTTKNEVYKSEIRYEPGRTYNKVGRHITLVYPWSDDTVLFEEFSKDDCQWLTLKGTKTIKTHYFLIDHWV